MSRSDPTRIPSLELSPHAVAAALVINALQVSPAEGLTANEANHRRQQHGVNVLQTIRATGRAGGLSGGIRSLPLSVL
jgi:hypothetical protein